MRARKIGVHNEYMESLGTPVIKNYNKLSYLPKEPTDTFSAQYASESRNHRYLSSTYISSNPIIINSWTADIARSNMLLSDSSDKSTSSYTSSNSSSSSSKSSSKPHSSPQLVIRSPPHRRQPLYSAARKTNSPTQNDISSSSATSSSSAPTISNNNNDIPEQVGENNEDLAIFSRNRESDPTPRFSTPTKRQRINSLIAQHVRLLSVTPQSSLKILDSGADISRVGEQWKMTDLSASSEVTI